MDSALQWSCFRLLKSTGLQGTDGFIDEQLEILRDSSCNGNVELIDESGEVNSWFTSLRTLQELCLRPNLLLCDRKWSTFSLAETMAISMRDIIGLI